MFQGFSLSFLGCGCLAHEQLRVLSHGVAHEVGPRQIRDIERKDLRDRFLSSPSEIALSVVHGASDLMGLLRRIPDEEIEIYTEGEELRIKGKRKNAVIMCIAEARLPVESVPHLYTKVNRRPPAEVDICTYFGIRPPSAHQMVVTLTRKGLIQRQPGTAGQWPCWSIHWTCRRLSDPGKQAQA